MTQINRQLPNYLKLNKKIRPQDDFFGYVNSLWCQKNPLPSTRGRWTHFDLLTEKNDKRITKIIDHWLDKKRLPADEKKVVAFYKALAGREKHSSKSLQSLQTLSRRVDNFDDTQQSREEMLGLMATWSIEVFLSVDVDIDPKNPKRHKVMIDPSGLTLPNRDYYLKLNAKMRKVRQTYLGFLRHHQTVVSRLGFVHDCHPDTVLKIETTLARYELPLAEAFDLEKIYNPYTWLRLKKAFKFDWEIYFKQIGLTPQNVIVSQPTYLKQALKYLKQLPIVEFKQYLKHLLALEYGDCLSDKVSKVQFDFFGKVISGQKKIKPLKERLVNQAQASFVDVLGRAYVAKYFDEDCKALVEELSDKVTEAFKKRLADNHWMSPTSRKYAVSKLTKIIVNVGYNDQAWQDYSRIRVVEGNLVETSLSLSDDYRRCRRDLLKIRPDRRRLRTINQAVQRVNAWTYLFLLNTNYPAGFLQAPLYDPRASLEYNLGSLGAVIGHELTHNFDTNGAKINKEGLFKQWLSLKEQRAFKRASKKLIKQADTHCPVPGVKMKGRQVVSELIADLGGLEIALDAAKARHQDPKARKEALRTVFIAYAYTHASNASEEFKIMQAQSNVHPDDQFRVNGIVSHCDDFYEVFGVTKGDKLYLAPQERAKIW